MTASITGVLLSMAVALTAPADVPAEGEVAEEQPAEEAPSEQAPPEQAPAEDPPPAAPAGYEATVHLLNGSLLHGRVVAEDLTTLTIVLEDMAAGSIQVDKSGVSSVVLGSALTPIAPVPPEPPQATVEPAQAVPTPAETGRSVGFGFNFGAGFGYGDTTNVLPGENPDPDKHFDIELPGFELRLFPDDGFSLDFLFKIGNSAALNPGTGYGWYYSNETDVMLMSLFFHFHLPRTALSADTNAALAIAPGLAFGGARMYGSPWWGQIGTSVRVGVDLTSSDGAFGFGIYARPGFSILHFPGYSEVAKAAEVLAELTWSWYLPRAPGH